MSSQLRSSIQAQLGWTWRDTSDTVPVVDTNQLLFRLALADGTGAGQADAVWHRHGRTLLADAADMLALDALPMPLFGGELYLAMQTIRAILLLNRDQSDGALVVGAAESYPWSGPFGSTSHTIAVPPGAPFLVAHPGTGWPVQVGANMLRLAASGGSVTYDAAILGTR